MTTALLFALSTVIAALAGGLLALRYKDRLHRVLGFTAGVLLGVVAFNLLPEIFELAEHTQTDPTLPMLALVSGFLIFHIIEKLAPPHHAHEGEYHDHHHPRFGQLSALAIIAHTFLDGMAIGLGFQIGAEVGFAIAAAVIAHAFADGLNTVTLMLRHRNGLSKTIGFLVLDALAPIAGALLAFTIPVSDGYLLGYLGFIAGFLLYLGAADILPEAHAKHPSKLTLVLTVGGVAFIYLLSQLVPHAH